MKQVEILCHRQPIYTRYQAVFFFFCTALHTCVECNALFRNQEYLPPEPFFFFVKDTVLLISHALEHCVFIIGQLLRQ